MISLKWKIVDVVEVFSMSITIQLNDRSIKLSDEVLVLLNKYRQLKKNDYEAGGILIGRENIDSGNLIIEYATEPYKEDKRTRYSFIRKDKTHIEFFNKLYNETRNIYCYIGEWHTHPEKNPSYSTIDIKNWRKIANSNSNNKEKVYYHLIVGEDAISIWEYCLLNNNIKKIY